MAETKEKEKDIWRIIFYCNLELILYKKRRKIMLKNVLKQIVNEYLLSWYNIIFCEILFNVFYNLLKPICHKDM